MRAQKLPKGIYARPGSPYLWGRIQTNGQDVRCSLKTANVREAADRMKAWRLTCFNPPEVGGESWETALVRWDNEVLAGGAVKPQVRDRYKSSICNMHSHFAGYRLADITSRSIADYVATRTGKVKNATIQRDLTALSSLLNACCAWGWLDSNPAKRFDRSIIRAAQTEMDPPSAEELTTVLGYAPSGMAAVLRFLDATGCRLNEAATLERRRIDWQAKTITLYKTKTTLRTIRFASPGGDATDLLATTVPSLSSPYVFRSRDQTAYRRLSTNFHLMVTRAVAAEAAAGRALRRFRIHDLRHGFALRWLRAGGSIYHLKEHLGHTSVSTTEIYLKHLTHDERQAAKYGATATSLLTGPKTGTITGTATETGTTHGLSEAAVSA